MIQRKQSLYLALAAAVLALTYFLPFFTYQRLPDGGAFLFSARGFLHAEGTPVADAALKVPFDALVGMLLALFVLPIFLFRDRKRQIRFVRFAYMMCLGVLAAVMVSHTSITAFLEQGSKVRVTPGAALVLPVIAGVLGIMAHQAIRKDEELVRSVDRLR